MKNKIKVYLQFPWRFSDPIFYKSMIKYPPKSIEYIFKDNIKSKKNLNFSFLNKVKKTIRAILQKIYPSLPNARLTKTKEKYDLIHCAHCLSLNKKSWVADIEFPSQLWMCGKERRDKAKNILKLLKNKNCKSILTWTKVAKKSIIDSLGDKEIGKKIEVVYPAIPFPEIKKKKHKGINLLFVGRYFIGKGGHHVIKVFDYLTKKYKDVNAIFVSNIPKKIKEKYSKNKKIKIFDIIPQEILFKEIYPKSDIFVYPGYSDSFGFAMIESMSYGIPVITVDGYSKEEIVKDMKTGLLIKSEGKISTQEIKKRDKNLDKKLIKDLIKKTLYLIKNEKLRKKMSNECLKEIKSGRFSIKNRNKRLEKIYLAAIKKDGTS